MGDEKGFDDWNCATDAKLQPGSSIKPLTVYAPAFETGIITPATVIKDLPIRYIPNEKDENAKPTAFPRNDDRQYSYSRTVKSGLVSSVNAVAVNTLDKIYKNLDEIPDTRIVQQLLSAIVIIVNATGDIVA